MDSFIVISLIKIAGRLRGAHDHAGLPAMGGAQSDRAHPGAARARIAWGRTACCSRSPTSSSCITKEDLVPPYVNKPLYLAAPFLAITMALLSISVIPFGPTITVAGFGQTWMQLTDLNIGVLFILAVVLDGRLRHRAGGLGVEQQVRAAGRAAQLGADDQLRAADVARDRRAAADLQHLEPARAGGEAGGRRSGTGISCVGRAARSSASSFS